MKNLQNIGLILFLIALAFFTSLLFFGSFKLEQADFNDFINNKGIQNEIFIQNSSTFINKEFNSSFEFSKSIRNELAKANEFYKQNQEWEKVIWDKPHTLSYELIQLSGKGFIIENKGLVWWFTFGLGILGSLMYILPSIILLGKPGIKNNGIFQHSATNRGWIGVVAFIYLVVFYILLYFNPDYIVNWIFILDPISNFLNGNNASQWFLYGFLYCVVMTVMAVRMYIKYRNNNYQILRTTSVLFFQIAFAFLIPEILVRFNQPYYDFKNIFPLDYDFFFEWNINNLIQSGSIGIFMLVWGIALTMILVPVLTYFYGKRWYCSWVCGCGGLAETLGDPFRQLSDKSIKSWKIERWLIHSVLIFSILMTIFTLYSYFSSQQTLLGISTSDIQSTYGFLIGSIFSGVIGTGFYPIFGNRTWCRFGCPLAAYMGIIQRFKSRFRITTNGGQCISCGNCSTYCEQGIDVRSYAQKGQNIVRASCVGCGICASVCPRGVLKLENGSEIDRIKSNSVLLGTDIPFLS